MSDATSRTMGSAPGSGDIVDAAERPTRADDGRCRVGRGWSRDITLRHRPAAVLRDLHTARCVVTATSDRS